MSSDGVRSLAERAASGDTSALRELLGTHLPSIEAFVRLRVGKLLNHKESCSDIAQSACREALEALPNFEFRGPAEFRAWLFKHAVHKITAKARHHTAEKRDMRREVAGNAKVAEEGDAELVFGAASICSPSRHAMAKEELAAFESAFAGLDEDYREAISLYKLAGLPYDEIAARMGKSEGAVRNLVYRGLARVSMAMGVADPGNRRTSS